MKNVNNKYIISTQLFFVIIILQATLTSCDLKEYDNSYGSRRQLEHHSKIKESIQHNKFRSAAEQIKLIEDNLMRDSMSILLANAVAKYKTDILPALEKKKKLLTNRNHLYENIDTYVHHGDILDIVSTTKYYEPRKKLEIEPYIKFSYSEDYKIELMLRTNIKKFDRYLYSSKNVQYEGSYFPSYYEQDIIHNIIESMSNNDSSYIWFQPFQNKRIISIDERKAAKDVLELYAVLNELLMADFWELSKK